MLPQKARLRSRAEFTEVTRGGIRAGGADLVVYLRPGDPTGCPRAGFVVSRSVGPAVIRNLVRRRLRHLVRERLDRLPAGSRVVVRVTPTAATASSSALARQLDAAFTRLATPAAAR